MKKKLAQLKEIEPKGIAGWPKIFTNKDFEYQEEDKERLKAMACADGLSGWGICKSGHSPAEHFGTGMVKIGDILDITPDDKSLVKLAKEKGWIK